MLLAKTRWPARLASARRSTLAVPATLVARMSSPAWLTLAPRWTTASQGSPSTTRGGLAGSVRSAATTRAPRAASQRAPGASGRRVTIESRQPSPSSRALRCEPMNPVAPVTRTWPGIGRWGSKPYARARGARAGGDRVAEVRTPTGEDGKLTLRPGADSHVVLDTRVTGAVSASRFGAPERRIGGAPSRGRE